MFSFSDTFARIKNFDSRSNSWLKHLIPFMSDLSISKLAHTEYKNILSGSEEYNEHLRESFDLSLAYVFKFFYRCNFILLSENAFFYGEFDNDEYSKCYPDLIQLSLTNETGFLEYPFMLEDLVKEISSRFYANDLGRYADGLYAENQINFIEALDFWLKLEVPTGFIRALSFHLANYYISDCIDNKDDLDESQEVKYISDWEKRISKLLMLRKSDWETRHNCLCCSCCRDIKVMHWCLNHILKNVTELSLPVHHEPKKLLPPYDLDKLFDNLSYNCNLHDDDLRLCGKAYSENIIEDENVANKWIAITGYNTEDIIRLALVYQFKRLKKFIPQDQLLKIKILSVWINISTPLKNNDRELKSIVQNHWLKPYYDWTRSLFDLGFNGGQKDIFCKIPEDLTTASKGQSFQLELADEKINEIIAPIKQKIKNNDEITGIISCIDNLTEQLTILNYEIYGSSVGYTDTANNWRIDLNYWMSFWLKNIPDSNATIASLGNYLNCYPHPKEFKTVEIQELADRVISITWSNIDKEVKEYVDSPDTLPLEKKMLFDLLKDLPGYDKSNSAQIIHDFYIEYKLSHSNNFMQRWETTEKLIVFQQQQRQQELEAVAEDTRKKVLFEMSHTIKNLMASVSEPLDMLKDQLEGTQRRTVENALAGAGLIRDLAVGVHMSMRGEPGAWRKDVMEPGFGAATLDKIILDAVRYAVSNMFDGKYFAQFVKNYFGRDLDTFMQAQNEWKAAVSAEDTFACINKYFFDFKIDCEESSLNIPIGDRDGTATKLLILFQELFLNAVKYSSFTEREKRFVKLDIAITQKNWNIKLSNSAVGRKNTKSSGIGLAVIKNFADLFEAKYDANCKNDTYISNINFSLNK